MRKLLFFVTLFFVFVLFFSTNSCSKKDSSVTPTIANIAGTYTYTETAQKTSGPVYNPLDSLDPCKQDDEIRFNTDSTYDYIDAGVVCNPPDSYTSTWILPNSSTLLLGSGIYTIASFNNKTLVLTNTDNSTVPAITYTITLTRL